MNQSEIPTADPPVPPGLIDRLQAVFRHSAKRQYEHVPVPPFVAFFHPEDSLRFLNYAIPDTSCSESTPGVSEALERLQLVFARRERIARFEFIEEYAPALSCALRARGFTEEARQCLMICSPGDLQPRSAMPGLAITRVIQECPQSDARSFLVVEHRAFEPADESVVLKAGEVEGFLARLGKGAAFLTRMKGQPISAAMYTEAYDGVVEIVGVATLQPFRRRGLASTVVSQAVRDAFSEGAELACLTAADEHAGRLYERLGFHTVASMLAYSASGRGEHNGRETDP